MAQYLALWQNGAISHETLLSALVKGEVLPGLDVEYELEMCSQEKLDNMSMAMDIGAPGVDAAEENEQAQEADEDESKPENGTVQNENE